MTEVKGSIFNIQKFSLHDGPGIRTVVFFKGCPLACKWCANPESQKLSEELYYDYKKCTFCLKCIKNCPNRGITAHKQLHRISINRDKCTLCGTCAKVCSFGALKIEGKQLSLSEVVTEVMKDAPFYEQSGGGVTLSGGEVLHQAEFAMKLMAELKQKNLHIAVETTGYADGELFNRFIDYVDLLLFDIKHYDNQKHIEGTSVSNEVIISNLKAAVCKNKEVVARIPIIPNFNSSLIDSEGFIVLLNSIPVKNVNLLPFHQFGEYKYDMLNMKYALKGYQNMHEEDLFLHKELFIKNGFNVQIGG